MLRRLLTLCCAAAILTLAAPALAAPNDRPDPCLTAPTVPAQIDELAAAIVAQPLEAALMVADDTASEPVFTVLVAPASFAIERVCKVALAPSRFTLKRPATRQLPGLLAAARQAMPLKHRLTPLLC